MERKGLTIPKSQKLNISQILNDMEATKVIIYESRKDLMIRK